MMLKYCFCAGMTFSSSGPTESGKSSAGEKKTPMNKSDNLCVRNSSLEENETQSSWDSSNMSYSDTTTVVEGEEESTRAAPVKPPHSFSTLIFLAIESSSSKALPVRDIYIWITKHFAYYCYAPVGWKNSVRHNLSLNKSFCKVERGPVSNWDSFPAEIMRINFGFCFDDQNVGKGSLWMVDPLHRPQLLQTLCKVPYMKSEILQQLTNESQSLRAKSEPIQASWILLQLNILYCRKFDKKVHQWFEIMIKNWFMVIDDKQENRRSVVIVTRSPSPSPSPSPPSPSPNRRNMPDPKLFPYLSRRLAFNVDHNHVDGPDADVDAATAMLALGQSHPVFHTNPTKHSLVHPSASPKKHLYANEIPRDEISG